eukprot:IDg9879t1
MNTAIPADTPYCSGLKLNQRQPHETVLDKAKYLYASVVGMLRYLVDSTRPDLSWVTNRLSRSLNQPTQRHWAALKRVARYLIQTKTHGLLYTRGVPELSAQSDADHAACADKRQSTYGNIIRFASNPIAWCTRRIKSVVTSTQSAEYIGLSETAHVIHWLRSLYTEITNMQLDPTTLENDNQAALICAKGNVPTRRIKYIDIRHHHIQDKAQDGTI